MQSYTRVSSQHIEFNENSFMKGNGSSSKVVQHSLHTNYFCLKKDEDRKLLEAAMAIRNKIFTINKSSFQVPFLDVDIGEKSFLALCYVYGRDGSTALAVIVQFPFMRQLKNTWKFCQNITQLGWYIPCQISA